MQQILLKKEYDVNFSFNVNVKSMYYMCRSIIPKMLQNNGGSIINIASIYGIVAPDQGWQAIEKLGTTDTLGYYLPHGPDWMDNATEELGYDMADCWASCMIPFDWGLQYDPRGYVFVSEMVTGVYVIQYDGDKDPKYNYPPLFET